MNAAPHPRYGPLVAPLEGTPALDVDALLADELRSQGVR